MQYEPRIVKVKTVQKKYKNLIFITKRKNPVYVLNLLHHLNFVFLWFHDFIKRREKISFSVLKMQEMILNLTFSHSNSNCNYRQFFNLKKNDLLKKRWARAPMSPPPPWYKHVATGWMDCYLKCFAQLS